MTDLSGPRILENKNTHKRISARLQVQVSWIDEKSGELVSVLGITENLGVKSVMVNLALLPSVGSEVRIRLLNEDETIIETLAVVMRIERNPGRPQIALSITEGLNDWQEIALTAAQDWVNQQKKLNDEGDDWLN